MVIEIPEATLLVVYVIISIIIMFYIADLRSRIEQLQVELNVSEEFRQEYMKQFLNAQHEIRELEKKLEEQ